MKTLSIIGAVLLIAVTNGCVATKSNKGSTSIGITEWIKAEEAGRSGVPWAVVIAVVIAQFPNVDSLDHARLKLYWQDGRDDALKASAHTQEAVDAARIAGKRSILYIDTGKDEAGSDVSLSYQTHLYRSYGLILDTIDDRTVEAWKQGQHEGRLEIVSKNNWPDDIDECILSKKVKLGMTTYQCKLAWGWPEDKRRNTTARGTDETWFYRGMRDLLHFDAGILTVIQN